MTMAMSMAAPVCAPFRAASRPCTLAQSRRAVLVCSRRRATVARAEIKQDVDQKMVTPDVDRSDVSQVEAGNLSNENAEKRADIGKSRSPDLFEAQAFDGPVPETINGRLAMLGVTSALASEFVSGVGLKQQIAEAPLSILGAFVIISLASYIPIFRGFTRKEPFANSFWSPKAENWNGRLAMVGFAGILLTEALSGKTVPEFYGLPHGVIPGL